jgi:hypothetical protein
VHTREYATYPPGAQVVHPSGNCSCCSLTRISTVCARSEPISFSGNTVTLLPGSSELSDIGLPSNVTSRSPLPDLAVQRIVRRHSERPHHRDDHRPENPGPARVRRRSSRSRGFERHGRGAKDRTGEFRIHFHPHPLRGRACHTPLRRNTSLT